MGPYLTYICSSLNECDQVVTTPNTMNNEMDASDHEFLCKCFSDGSVSIENFKKEQVPIHFSVNQHAEEKPSGVCASFCSSGRTRLLFVGRSDNILTSYRLCFQDGKERFIEFQSKALNCGSPLTCMAMTSVHSTNNYSHECSMLMAVGLYSGQVLLFHILYDESTGFLQWKQYDFFSNKAPSVVLLRILPCQESYELERAHHFRSFFLFSQRSNGIMEVSEVKVESRTLIVGGNPFLSTVNVSAQNRQTINAIRACPCSIACTKLFFPSLICVLVGGESSLSLIYSKDEFKTFRSIPIQVPSSCVICAVSAVRHEKEDGALLTLLCGDQFGQLYRIKIVKESFEVVAKLLEFKSSSFLSPSLSSMTMHCVLVKKNGRHKILFHDRVGTCLEF
ncbi:hypothetical protein C9374_000581 [Naegleria lovaniensis]|uniref:Uncharacterized protein n=1 Tax=Naegleria lovaniensis TaxID=51637 RepID=A0AA88GT59_NAELO|nr:uncharacterized protein C9374_000581 [Naegleria lovaniensis]KAG2388417.1 hypothetical protein C9374_000581 [Naegleria lovaniensis]